MALMGVDVVNKGLTIPLRRFAMYFVDRPTHPYTQSACLLRCAIVRWGWVRS